MPEDSHAPSSSVPASGGRPGSSSSGRPAGWQPPSPEELQKILPKYEVTALLGKGGMGAVYQGIQRSLERPVAIKILSAELDEREQGFAERFKNEARAMGQLNHPGIVGVHDFGETPEGLLFIGMEFVAGTDVSRMIAKKGKLPPDHAMAITAHVCDALAYAHRRGIIHRDIKPANIMVGYDGVVKVADFGLAKMSHAAESGLTQSGVAMGTMHYMAPEALTLGIAVDHRADIYAVGVMLYQMLTGKLPRGMFDPPSKQIPGLDARYDDIITKAIRDDRELRYQSADELRADLDVILTKPVAHVVEGSVEAPAALPTQERPQRTGPHTREQSARSPEETPAKTVQTRSQSKQHSSAPLLGAIAVAAVLALVAGMWTLFNADDDGLKRAPKLLPENAPDSVAVALSKKPAAPAPPAWPTGPNHRSVGRFRAWSSVPNDPAIDLSMLQDVGAAKQLHMKSDAWLVLLPDGTVRSNDQEVDGVRDIRQICPGWDKHFALIDTKGRLFIYPKRVDAASLPPEGMGPVKDAYVAPFHHAALLEDGSLKVWGKAYDGIKDKGNPEWEEKPALPAHRKAVALSSSDNSMVVKLDDGSLRVWGIVQGMIQPPAAFAAGKLDAVAIDRLNLFGVPKDGSPALQWGLAGKGNPVPFPGKPVTTGLIETSHGMLALDKAGRAIPSQTLAAMDAGVTDPAVAAALKAVPQVRQNHIAMFHTVTKPHAVRLLWLDESAPAPALSANPAGRPAWPKDGPFFRSEGRFKAWSSARNDRSLDLSKLRGIEDVAQVYQGSGNWVVLRANGDTISSDGAGDRKNIRRICPGFAQNYLLISRDGRVEVIAPNLETMPEFVPPPGLTAKDGFISPTSFALLEDGGLAVWGRNFDGKKEEGNGEWTVKPELPPGRKAVAISHAEFVVAAQLEDRSLLLWRAGGLMALPATLRTQKFSHFAFANQTLFGLLADGGLPVMWTAKDSGLKPVPGLRSATAVQEAGKQAVCFFNTTGQPTLICEAPLDETTFDRVVPRVGGAVADLCSFRSDYNAKTATSVGRLLWYDGKGQPFAARPADKAQPKAASQVTPSPAAAVPKAPPSSPLDQIQEFRTRVANYQKARHAQLGDLTAKYRNALTAALADAKKSGEQADVAELDAAIARTTVFSDAIETNLISLDAKPLPTLAPLGGHVPKRLQDLRAIFDREIQKIEAELVSSLDQSLLIVQTNLVKAVDIPAAKQVETFRKELLVAFPQPIAKPGPVPPPVASKMATAPGPTSPAPAVAAPVAASSMYQPVQGRIKGWWKTAVDPVNGPLGTLEKWSDTSDINRLYKGKVSDLTDFVSVVAKDQLFAGLRANGEMVEVRKSSFAANRYMALTTPPPSGTRFVKFGRSGGELIMIDGRGNLTIDRVAAATSPPVPVINVVDAAVESMAGGLALALLTDGTLKWWGQARWPAPPVSARKDIVAISQSRYLAAAVDQEGSVIAWNSGGRQTFTGKSKKVVDVAVCEGNAYVLNAENQVLLAFSSTSGVRTWDVLLENVEWIKPAGMGLLAGLKNGRIVTDPATAKAEPTLEAILQAAGPLPPEAIDLAITYFGSVVDPNSCLFWIEPVATPAKPSP